MAHDVNWLDRYPLRILLIPTNFLYFFLNIKPLDWKKKKKEEEEEKDVCIKTKNIF